MCSGNLPSWRLILVEGAWVIFPSISSGIVIADNYRSYALTIPEFKSDYESTTPANVHVNDWIMFGDHLVVCTSEW